MDDRKATECPILMVLAASAWLTAAPPVRAQEIDETRAIKVKAAYLYNFAKFIKWPDEAFEDDEASFVICVLGDDPFGQVLDNTVKSKKIGKRSVKIQHVRWTKPADRARVKDCHILYISDSERGRLKEIFAALENRPVLLVSDIPGFARDGGMIRFVLARQRIIFEINRGALQQADLKASAKLLKLARIVTPKNRRPERSRTTGAGYDNADMGVGGDVVH